MKRATAVLTIVAALILFAACDVAPMAQSVGTALAPSGTPNATEWAFASTRQVIDATATGAVLDLERERQRATNMIAQATADAARFQATQAEDARAATSQAFVAGMTQAALQATEGAARATQGAQATADAMALMVAQWTATGDAALAWRAERSWSGTATADASDATATAVYVGMISTEQAEILRMNTERQRIVNDMTAVMPFVIGILATLMLGLIAVVLVRVAVPVLRVIQRDARGDAPIIITPQGAYVDLDRNTGPMLDPSQTMLADGATQERTTARDQMVDLQHRGSLFAPQQKTNGNSGGKEFREAAPKAGPRYMVYRSGQTPPVTQEIIEVLEADWKEAQDGR